MVQITREDALRLLGKEESDPSALVALLGVPISAIAARASGALPAHAAAANRAGR